MTRASRGAKNATPPPVIPHEIQTVGIIGSGIMGAGIAQVAAQRGFGVTLYDLSEFLLEKALKRITSSLEEGVRRGKVTDGELKAVQSTLKITTDLGRVAQSDLIIEAAPETMELKQELFKQLDEAAPEGTLLASNTSSLSITAMAGVTKRPGQVAGLHFFNPVPMMKLVEVIQGHQTSEETVGRLLAFSKALGKTPVLAQDTPGFIVNRVARPFYGEALRLLGENRATVDAIDTVLKEAGGFKMGPFELMDLIGIDVNFAVTQSVYNGYFQEPRYRPHPIQAKMVAAGLLGRKTGRGFYAYE